MGLAEEIKRMILSALESMEVTSANPTHINRLIQVNNIETPDLDQFLKEQVDGEPEIIKREQDIDDALKDVRDFKFGNVGDLQRMSSRQFSNIKAFAANPFMFLTKNFLTKFTKGVGILFLVELARQVAQFIIDEFFKPGRLFDVRFREAIDKQVIKFLERKEQEELRAGLKQVITTTMFGLRGTRLKGQIGGNFFSDPLRGNLQTQFIDERIPNNVIAQEPQARSWIGSRGKSARFTRR